MARRHDGRRVAHSLTGTRAASTSRGFSRFVERVDRVVTWGEPTGPDRYDPVVLPVSWNTIRVFLHVLAATLWVGGQLTLAGLVPGLRAAAPDAPRAAARRFNQIAWPAFGVLVATGIWNVLALSPTGRARTARR